MEFGIHFAQQVCSGMKFLSEKGIIHHDLALRNCWLVLMDGWMDGWMDEQTNRCTS